MRRDYVTLDVRNIDENGDGDGDGDEDEDERPTVVLSFDGPTEVLDERLSEADGDPLERERIDVGFRFQTPVDADDASGVFSLTNRLTGEFVLEVNAGADAVLDLVSTARAADDPADGEGRYRIVVRDGGDEVATYEKRTLLVYDDEGSLLRQHSLIPSGVEL